MVVTGAIGEFGWVIARTLVQAGADVMLTYLNNPGQGRGARGGDRRDGPRARAFRVDVTSGESITASRDVVRHDREIVVNNAR